VTGQYQEVPNLKTIISVEGCGKTDQRLELLGLRSQSILLMRAEKLSSSGFIFYCCARPEPPSPKDLFCAKIVVS